MLRTGGRNRDAARVIRVFRAADYAGLLAELASDFLDHAAGGPADGVDGQAAEKKRHHGAKEQPENHLGVHEVHLEVVHELGDGGIGRDDRLAGTQDKRVLVIVKHRDLQLLHIRGKKGEGGKRGRSDGKAFAGRGGGITE